jgi:hypothetical protein
MMWRGAQSSPILGGVGGETLEESLGEDMEFSFEFLVTGSLKKKLDKLRESGTHRGEFLVNGIFNFF